MNLSLKALFALLIAGVLFSACNKDDDDDDQDDPTPTSYMKYDGETVELDKGFIENYGEYDSAVYNLDLTLLSPGFTVHLIDGEVDSVSGTGSGFYFEIFTSKPNELDSRTYTMDTVNIGADGTFDFADFVVNFNPSTFSGVWNSLTEGTLVVSKDGSIYEFTVNGIDEFGKSVQAYYKGSVDYYDYDTKSATTKKKSWR